MGKNRNPICVEGGKRLKAAIKARKLKYKDVAANLPGLSVSRISNWTNGWNSIPVEWAVPLAELLHVTPGYLLTLEDTPDTRTQALIATWKQLDQRGKDTVLRAAESQSAIYQVDKPHHNHNGNGTDG